MALWKVITKGREEIVFSEGALSIKNPPSFMNVKRHIYTVPYSNIGRGAIMTSRGKTYHVPSWTEVHPQTTLDDIMIEKKPFEEVFVEPKSWKFESGSSDKVYTVKENKQGTLSCDCWGYIAHKNCKHVKEVKQTL